jgi:hypothetical protein
MLKVYKVLKMIYINSRDEKRDTKIAHEQYLRFKIETALKNMKIFIKQRREKKELESKAMGLYNLKRLKGMTFKAFQIKYLKAKRL